MPTQISEMKLECNNSIPEVEDPDPVDTTSADQAAANSDVHNNSNYIDDPENMNFPHLKITEAKRQNCCSRQ